MATSARIQEIILKYLSDGQHHSVQEMKQYLAQSEIGKYTEGQFAGSINTLLRNGSIKKIDRGLYAIKERSVNMKTCFVVSPIGEPDSPTRVNADKLFRHIIEPVCKACDFEAVRADLLDNAGSITQTVVDHLETAELVIADVTEHNPNVFYEMGFRTRTNKPIIHLKAKGETLPFDISAIRAFEYDLTDLDCVEDVKSRLERTIQSFTYSVQDREESSSEEDAALQVPDTMPVLFQILDAIDQLKSEIGKNNNEIIRTVINSMQTSQPQVSAETALQMQLIGSLMQNPENFMKLIEISDKLPKPKK